MPSIKEKMQDVRAANESLENCFLLSRLPQLLQLWQDFFSAWQEAHPEDQIELKQPNPNALMAKVEVICRNRYAVAMRFFFVWEVLSFEPLVVVCKADQKIETLFSLLDLENWCLRQYAQILIQKQKVDPYLPFP